MFSVLERRAPEVSREPPRRRPGATTVVLTLAAIALTALLNCDDLVKIAQRQPFGWQRTVALRLAHADQDVSRALWLDRPRRALESALGHHNAGPSVAPSQPSTPATAPPASTPAPSPSRAQPTATHPLRIYFGGDSVAAEISTAFAREATATKVVKTAVDYRISTGLSRPDYFNWPQRLRQVILRAPKPQVVIVMFGANDLQPIMTAHGAADTGTAKWLAEYRSRVSALMGMLSASGLDVYWLGQPLMRSSTFSRLINGVDAIYADEASRHAHVTFVDTRPLLADAHGHYSAFLPGPSGRQVLVRTPDGVHLTDAGGQRVAQAVMRLVATAWRIPLR